MNWKLMSQVIELNFYIALGTLFSSSVESLKRSTFNSYISVRSLCMCVHLCSLLKSHSLFTLPSPVIHDQCSLLVQSFFIYYYSKLKSCLYRSYKMRKKSMHKGKRKYSFHIRDIILVRIKNMYRQQNLHYTSISKSLDITNKALLFVVFCF